jgi:hypothetical protein
VLLLNEEDFVGSFCLLINTRERSEKILGRSISTTQGTGRQAHNLHQGCFKIPEMY